MLSFFILAIVIGFSWVALVEHVLTITHLPKVQRAHSSRSYMVFFYLLVPPVTVVALLIALSKGEFWATVRAIANRTISLRNV